LSPKVSGGNFHPARAIDLATVFNYCGVVDLHIVGGVFTWRKNIDNRRHVRKKLNQCIKNFEWRLQFSHITTATTWIRS